MTLIALILVLVFATPLWAAPHLVLRWKQPASPTPITAYAIYKRAPSTAETWVRVRLLANIPPRLSWSDYAVATGEEWCYTVRAMGADGEEASNNPVACGVAP